MSAIQGERGGKKERKRERAMRGSAFHFTQSPSSSRDEFWSSPISQMMSLPVLRFPLSSIYYVSLPPPKMVCSYRKILLFPGLLSQFGTVDYHTPIGECSLNQGSGIDSFGQGLFSREVDTRFEQMYVYVFKNSNRT